MTYRTVLVDFTADERVEGRLQVARSLALRFDAALIGMHVLVPPFEPAVWDGGMSVYIGPELVEAQRKASRKARDRVRALFERICGADPAMTWREAEGDPGWVLAEAARTADLVVAGQGEADAAGALDTLEQLVVAAGVPVLMLPPAFSGDVGRTVLVAWNGSREAARALHDALPFLQYGAERVFLCAVGEKAAASLEAAAAMLQRHGIPVHPEPVGGPDASAGEILLAEATAHGADLLVMGAYGHARLRELIFGGATRHVLRHATLPVLFSS